MIDAAALEDAVWMVSNAPIRQATPRHRRPCQDPTMLTRPSRRSNGWGGRMADVRPRVAARTVLASVDGQAYASLRTRSTPRAERYALGKSLRQQVPRSSLSAWDGSADRRDVLDLLEEAHDGRISWLVPVRVGRMVASPYGFLRGAAVVMAEDFARLPATGITPVICGDAHVGNIGFYGSPEQELVLDLNDFDEAHPGSWEWDLRRLVASVWVAGRQNDMSEDSCADAATSCVASYRRQLWELSDQPLLGRSFQRLDLDRLQGAASETALRQELDRAAQKARSRTSDRALPRFTEQHEGRRRIVEEPPLITRVGAAEAEELATALDGYLATLAPHWRRILGGYTIVDIAHKVVGVGSVGLRAYVVLCEGSDPDDVLFLQLKQARRSVIAPFVHGDSAWHAHQGERVVEYQQALQTVSDPLLGWASVAGRQYYVRQFRNMKGSVALDAIDRRALADYAGICGQLLAKGHARTSGASMIAGYLGKSDKVDRALCRFARAYADQTEHDHQRLVDAVARGAVPCEAGV
jgi:uncharacterized protein (DUF2252 family)